MENAEIITATDASRHFSEMLHRVCYGGESFMIKKGNRVMAMISPVSETAEHILQQAEAVAAPVSVSDYAIEPKFEEGFSPSEAEYFETLLSQISKVPVGVE